VNSHPEVLKFTFDVQETIQPINFPIIASASSEAIKYLVVGVNERECESVCVCVCVCACVCVWVCVWGCKGSLCLRGN